MMRMAIWRMVPRSENTAQGIQMGSALQELQASVRKICVNGNPCLDKALRIHGSFSFTDQLDLERHDSPSNLQNSSEGRLFLLTPDKFIVDWTLELGR